MSNVSEYRHEIVLVATRFSLDPDLVEAVVMQESAGRTDAFRFEPAFYDRYLKGRVSYDVMLPRRISSSYGLMQVMYPTALQYGYPRHEQPEGLFIPATGLHYGCAHLSAMHRRFEHDTRKALEGYNGGPGNVDGRGPDAEYATEVLARLPLVRAARAH